MPSQYNTGNGLVPVEEPRGAWVAYYSDYSGMALFGSEIEALRHAVGNSMTVAFWEFGRDLSDVDQARRQAARGA